MKVLYPIMGYCAFLCYGKELIVNNQNTKKMILAAMFLALAYVLPFLTGQIQQIGNMLCPMHIPVLLCGFICGPMWGAVVGIVAPILRSLTLGMPVFFPMAVCMALELAVYGFVTGILYRMLPKNKINIYVTLVISMITGRLVWGAARFLCTGLNTAEFGLKAFWAGAVTTAIPGIILQIILVPIVVMVYEMTAHSDSGNLV